MKSEEQFSQDKKTLRCYIKSQRKIISDKLYKDNEICKKFLQTQIYKKSDTVLVYCSLQDEIDTSLIIKTAFKDGKKVAAPCCLDNNGRMEFYFIDSFDDLHNGSFNVPEPNADDTRIVDDFDNAVIVVPGLCFDKDKYRVGYGKGYYDRYLQIHSLISVGLCYNSFIVDKVPTDIYDKNVDFVITESQILS